MTQYAKVAIEAACAASEGVCPITAWENAASKMFLDGKGKPCPKSAFLGLAESGEIAGIGSGNFTTSTENKRYAIAALKLLRSDEFWAKKSPQALWSCVKEVETMGHNSQMHVVIALWRAKKFVGQSV